jgi:hypothetical protein
MSHASPSNSVSWHDGSTPTLREEIDELELKLPKLSSLAIIIMSNVLMQVRLVKAILAAFCSESPTPDIVLQHRCIKQCLFALSWRVFVLLGFGHRYSDCLLRNCSYSTYTTGQRC